MQQASTARRRQQHLTFALLAQLVLCGGARISTAAAPASEIHLANRPKAQLPNECMTYAQRYEHASDLDRLEAVAEELDPRSTKVVLLKLHIGEAPHEDLLLSLHSLAIEVMESGWHFFILLQGREELTRQEVLHFLPKSLRQFLVVHDYHNSLRLYPRLAAAFEQFAEQYAEGEHSGLGLGPGLHGAYLTEVAFMHQYHKYEFLYTIEYDARLVGHWGRFLDASVRIAEQAQGHDLAAVLEEQQKSQSNRPPHAAGQADLIVYSEPIFGSKWSESIINLDLTGSWESFVMVYGASRKMFNVLHDMSLKGQSLYVEALLPTAAMIHGLKAVAIHGATPSYEAYHCCTHDAEQLYRQFALNQTCTVAMLLHPIKKAVTKPDIREDTEASAESL